jgi:hypothetical protein
MTTRNRPDADDADGLLVLTLASGCTYEQAADKVGVGVSTVSRRMREYGFRQRVTEMRAELIERGGGRIADEMAASAAFLARVRDDDSEPTSLRIKAATELLASAMRYRTLDKSESFKPTMADLDADLMDWASGPRP